MNKERNELRTMLEHVAWMRGMTTSELITTFPRNFVAPKFHPENPDLNTIGFLSIDARLWKMTGEYMKFLSKFLKIEYFVSCDLEGNVLEPIEPMNFPQENFVIGQARCPYCGNTTATVPSEMEKCGCMELAEKYEEGTNRILIQGFHVEENKLIHSSGTHLAIKIEGEWKFYSERIEDLANSDTKYFLTDKAMKMIDILM